MKKVFVWLLVFLLSGIFSWAKIWNYKKDCQIHGQKLYLLKKRIKEEKANWQKVWACLPDKEKANFQSELKAILAQKDKISKVELNKKLSNLSDKYYHIYLKYAPRKRGIGKKIINSAKTFFHLMVQFAKDTYKVYVGTIKQKMEEENDPNYIPQYVNGARG